MKFIAQPKPSVCTTCNRDPARVNNDFAECSHIECTHRERSWSNGTGPGRWRPAAKEVNPIADHLDKVKD
jgi:hypothetical protein